MTKLILLLILGLLAAYYFPDTRRAIVDKTKTLWVPVVEWNNRQRMQEIAQDVVEHERLTGRLPDRRGWKQWLDYRYAMEASKTDAWGTMYGLRVWADSIGVVSAGPDRKPDTGDEFLVTARRDRHGRVR